TGAVDVEGQLDRGLAGGAGQGRGACWTRGGALGGGALGVGHRGSASSRAVRNAALSSGVPMETRSQPAGPTARMRTLDRKSTRLNSSHVSSSYAVFCLKKKHGEMCV